MNRRDLLAGAMAPLFIPRRAFGANDRPSFGIIGTLPVGAGFSPNQKSLKVFIGGYTSAVKSGMQMAAAG